MPYSPFPETLLCLACLQLWSPIICQFLRDTECHKCFTQIPDETLCTWLWPEYHGPVWIPILDYYIGLAVESKVVAVCMLAVDCLKWVVWRWDVIWRLHLVGFGCLVAIWTLVTNSGNISCDVGPLDRVHGSGTHGADSLVGGMESIKNRLASGITILWSIRTTPSTTPCRQLPAICWESYFKVVDEVEECLVSGCGLTDHIPCDNCVNCFQGSSRSGNCSIVLCCVSISFSYRLRPAKLSWRSPVVSLSRSSYGGSPGRCSRSGWPVGWLEAASAPRFFWLGTCMIANLVSRVFSLRLSSRLLSMSVSDLSFRIWSSGLWSVATIRSPGWQSPWTCVIVHLARLSR